jgi:hypothetical protein
MSVYQPGIPTGTVNLDVDYLNIQNNFTQLDTSFGIDHLPFSNQTAQNGYHKSIHFNPVSTTVTNPPNNQPVVTPTATPGFGQAFSSQINDGINTDQAFYFLTGGNRLIQLTRNFVPTNSQNGATCLPGGLILNWGVYNASGGNFSSGSTTNASSGESSIVLTQAFPNKLYFVGGNLTYTQANLPSGTGTLNIRASQLNTGPISTLSWQVYCNTNNYLGFVWWALGN